MTYQEMKDALDIRFGGGLNRMLGSNPGRLDSALNEAQQQVHDEMVAAHGKQSQPNLEDETDDEGNYLPRPDLLMELSPIADVGTCQLPSCYHRAVVCGAARLLAKMMGDNMPTFTNPTKLWQDYNEAIALAHRVHSLSLQTEPNRMVDAYAPTRHYEEDF